MIHVSSERKLLLPNGRLVTVTSEPWNCGDCSRNEPDGLCGPPSCLLFGFQLKEKKDGGVQRLKQCRAAERGCSETSAHRDEVI